MKIKYYWIFILIFFLSLKNLSLCQAKIRSKKKQFEGQANNPSDKNDEENEDDANASQNQYQIEDDQDMTTFHANIRERINSEWSQLTKFNPFNNSIDIILTVIITLIYYSTYNNSIYL